MYNAAAHLRQAIDSILAQTFQDFEFIIVDDGSTDSGVDIVASYSDGRIRLLKEPHRGLVASLNAGMSASVGTYIARMDADDISLPNRIELQVKALQQDSETGLISSWFRRFPCVEDANVWHPVTDLAIKCRLLFSNQFCHGSAMFRRQLAIDCGAYREAVFPAEDYDLWLRLSERASVMNIGMVLYGWRASDTQISVSRNDAMHREVVTARDLAIERLLLGIDRLGCELATPRDNVPTLLSAFALSAWAITTRQWTLAFKAWWIGMHRTPVLASRCWVAVMRHFVFRLLPERAWRSIEWRRRRLSRRLGWRA